MTTSLTIAQAAEATGLSVHTLRYYERIGLLDPVERRDNRHRRYTQEDLNWIDFLKKLKANRPAGACHAALCRAAPRGQYPGKRH